MVQLNRRVLGDIDLDAGSAVGLGHVRIGRVASLSDTNAEVS